MVWLFVALGCILGAVAYWQLVVAEGAYLGAPVVALLYDWTASRYDRIKQYQPEDEEWFLARPLCKALASVERPLILDVATGTGRLVEALFRRPEFDGVIVGLDLSRGMLTEAQRKLAPFAERSLWVWADARELPFDSDVFDVVACLEALEFMPDPAQVVREMVRVLRPGGLFLATNRVGPERALLPGRTYSEDRFRALLEAAGLQAVQFAPWQVHYDQVWARKPGWASRVEGAHPVVHAFLRCPACGQGHLTPLAQERGGLRCCICGRGFPQEGNLILLHRPSFWTRLWRRRGLPWAGRMEQRG
ncbi:MAG: class I SAM-dependent methyltransferase [Anaerolineae bacterium]